LARPAAPEAFQRKDAVRLAAGRLVARPARLLDGPTRVLAGFLVVPHPSVDVRDPVVPGTGEGRVVDTGQQGGSRPECLEALGPRAHEVLRLRPAQHELEVQVIALAGSWRAGEGVERVLQRLGGVAMRIGAGRLLGEPPQMMDCLGPGPA